MELHSEIYKSRSTRNLPDDVLICTCKNVRKGEIVKAIEEKNLRTLEEIQEATTAATGCNLCQISIGRLLNYYLALDRGEISEADE
ncbi:MAG: (2Fe-2S)-binding protein [Rhodospirillales bacterium]